MMIQTTDARATCRPRSISGNASTTMVVSTAVIRTPVITTASARPVRPRAPVDPVTGGATLVSALVTRWPPKTHGAGQRRSVRGDRGPHGAGASDGATRVEGTWPVRRSHVAQPRIPCSDLRTPNGLGEPVVRGALSARQRAGHTQGHHGGSGTPKACARDHESARASGCGCAL